MAVTVNTVKDQSDYQFEWRKNVIPMHGWQTTKLNLHQLYATNSESTKTAM